MCQNDFLRRMNAENVIEILLLCGQNSDSLQTTTESAIWYLVTHPNDFDNNKLQQLSSIPQLFPRIFRELVQLTIPEPHPNNVPEAQLSNDLLHLLDVKTRNFEPNIEKKSSESSDVNLDVIDKEKADLMKGHRCSCKIPSTTIIYKVLCNKKKFIVEF